MNRSPVVVLTLVLALGLTACASSPPPTLYDQLGQMPGITRIVDSFLFRLADNDTIIHHFADTDLDRFREKLIEQLCDISDGPCHYTGDTMEDVHRDIDLTDGHFNSLVETLILAMESEGVPTAAQNGLLARLAPMYGDIMHPAGPH